MLTFFFVGTGDCTWSDLTVTNDAEVTLTHKFHHTFTPTSRLRTSSGSFDAVEADVIIESRLHARKASMAIEYTGPVQNVQPAIDLYNKVAVDGRDDIVVKPVNTEKPVDLTFNRKKINGIKATCNRFPSSVKSTFC